MLAFLSSNLNSLPIEKAINPNATSATSPNASTACIEENPKPSTPKAPTQYGPIRTPAIKYAVTSGNLNGLKSLVIRSPAKRAIDTDNNVLIIFTPFDF